MEDEEGGAALRIDPGRTQHRERAVPFRPLIPAHQSHGFYTFTFTLPLQDT